MELSDGESAQTLYLVSVGVHGSLIHDLPQHNCEYPEVVAHEKHWINDILTISWKQLESITLTDQDILHLPEKLIIAWSEKFKTRKILSHAYTVRIIIESGGLLWQISHNLIQSRIQKWSENYTSPTQTRMVIKERAGVPLLMREDMADRATLRRQWAGTSQTPEYSELQLTDEEDAHPRSSQNKATTKQKQYHNAQPSTG